MAFLPRGRPPSIGGHASFFAFVGSALIHFTRRHLSPAYLCFCWQTDVIIQHGVTCCCCCQQRLRSRKAGTSIIKKHLTSFWQNCLSSSIYYATAWPAQVACTATWILLMTSAACGNALQTIVPSHIDPHQLLGRDAEGKHTNHGRILLN